MAARDIRSRLSRRATKAGVFIQDDLADRLLLYYDLLSRWNQKINLTALDNPDEAIDRLLLEPLVAARHVAPGVDQLMDVGSGGGSPALPLKLALPQIRVTMVEIKARKSAFLREAVRHLQLSNVWVETSRYEELLARPELHERFQALSIRAVRVEMRTLRTLQAFLAPGGHLLMFRSASGPEVPPVTVPPLEFLATHPLLETLQSRLTILVKRPVGPVFHVERG